MGNFRQQSQPPTGPEVPSKFVQLSSPEWPPGWGSQTCVSWTGEFLRQLFNRIRVSIQFVHLWITTQATRRLGQTAVEKTGRIPRHEIYSFPLTRTGEDVRCSPAMRGVSMEGRAVGAPVDDKQSTGSRTFNITWGYNENIPPFPVKRGNAQDFIPRFLPHRPLPLYASTAGLNRGADPQTKKAMWSRL